MQRPRSLLPSIAFLTVATCAQATVVLTQISVPSSGASTSSDPFGFAPSRALDGTYTGINPDFSHTNNGPNEWWRVTLPANTNVDVVRIFNRTDCCSSRINGAVVKAYGDAGASVNTFSSAPISGAPRRTDINFGTTQNLRVLEVSHQNEYLSLAEVQLFTKSDIVLPLGTNLSTAGIAAAMPSQGSAWNGGDYASGGSYPAEYAVDGNPGNFNHTADFGAAAPLDQWWKLDLGEPMQIQQVNIDNRGDGCCQERLRDLTVQVLDGSGSPIWTSSLLNPGNSMSNPASIPLDIQALNGGVPVLGSQVRITRTRDAASSAHDSYVLSMGEVRIIGGSMIPEPTSGILLLTALALAGGRRNRK